jgi:hypothetical protein
MKKHIVRHASKDGSVEWHFVGHETWDDFDGILALLEAQGCTRVGGVLDGIHTRHVELRHGGMHFELAFHEDLGNYLKQTTMTPQADLELERLGQNAIVALDGG